MELYKLDSAILKVLDDGFFADEETGEVLFDAENFEKLIQDREEKWENICLYIKNLEAYAKAIKAEEQALSARRKSAENKAENLKNYLLGSMELVGDKKFKTARAEATLRKASSVAIDNMDLIPEIYLKRVESVSPNKVEIKKALKAGEEIAGARLIEKNSIGVK